jgi:hypothetical protein
MFLKSLQAFLNALNPLNGGPIYACSTHNVVVDVIDCRLFSLSVLKFIFINLIGQLIALELLGRERLDCGIWGS